MSQKFLTKSKFTAAFECPRKLYYGNNKEYGSSRLDDAFLKALAQGGFQVGALAQQYFPGGVTVDTLDKTEALKQTNELLKKDRIIIFEAAFQFENLFIRADIVRKSGKFIELIEVKAKSTNSEKEFPVWNKQAYKSGKYKLVGDYADKIIDLAFQTHVLQMAHPQFTVRSFLMLADKAKLATVDGLNQHFKIARDERGREGVKVTGQLTAGQLGGEILKLQELTDDIKHVFDDVVFNQGPSFLQVIQKLSQLTESNKPGESVQGAGCKGCEFRVDETPGCKSGFKQCWTELGHKPKDIESRAFVFDLWNFRGAPKMLEAGIYYADQLSAEDLKVEPRKKGGVGLSNSQRQMIQVEFCQGVRKEPYFDSEPFQQELEALEFPLHFIDFETSMVAIPFHAKRAPYEQMAFQFSHHVLHKNGRIEHRTEYLDERVGVFPNFDFVRALKAALSSDNGCVLRFAAHENTVLNQIRAQLLASSESDRSELVEWIESLTTPPGDLEGEWTPSRQFVDMCELTKRFYYLPSTSGSNSIKAILPAVLSVAGPELAERFPEWVKRDGAVGFLDPYSLLPPLFADVPPEELAKVELYFAGDDGLANGGAAMTAWSRMQFSSMSALERAELCAALKRYCGLDTLAMVMIWEWWMLVIARDKKRVA